MPCGSKVGWAIFADYRVMPLVLPIEVCENYDALLASLDRIDGKMRWANASNIGKGVTWAMRSARAIDKETRVVFFTDGQESPPLRNKDVTPPMGDITPGDVGGWLIGVGGDMPARIPRFDGDGNPIGFWAAADVVQRFGPERPARPMSTFRSFASRTCSPSASFSALATGAWRRPMSRRKRCSIQPWPSPGRSARTCAGCRHCWGLDCWPCGSSLTWRSRGRGDRSNGKGLTRRERDSRERACAAPPFGAAPGVAWPAPRMRRLSSSLRHSGG
jgi:hypothetical protein